MKNRTVAASRRLTARSRITAVLTQEILDRSENEPFLLSSEHQLCRRFGVSRVTARLVLSDLEHRGIIYRQHGKGTFAHGRTTGAPRHIGVLIKTLPATENRPLAEFLRGVQTVVRSLRCAIILISQSPGEWRPELAGVLLGVIVMAENVSAHDIDNLKNRRLPFLKVEGTELSVPQVDLNLGDRSMNFFALGQHAAETLSHAFFTGAPVDSLWVDDLCEMYPSQLNQTSASFS